MEIYLGCNVNLERHQDHSLKKIISKGSHDNLRGLLCYRRNAVTMGTRNNNYGKHYKAVEDETKCV